MIRTYDEGRLERVPRRTTERVGMRRMDAVIEEVLHQYGLALPEHPLCLEVVPAESELVSEVA